MLSEIPAYAEKAHGGRRQKDVSCRAAGRWGGMPTRRAALVILEPEVGRGPLGEPLAEPPQHTAFGERRRVRQPSMERRKR